MAEASTRWARWLSGWQRQAWPELVFGAAWIVFGVLSHTVFGDDEGVGHVVTRVAMYVATAGYAGAAVVAYLERSD